MNLDQPNIIGDMLNSLRELGYKPKWNPDMKSITFFYFGNKVTLFVRKQYFNGKGLAPGFGFDKLISQLKERPIPKPKTVK